MVKTVHHCLYRRDRRDSEYFFYTNHSLEKGHIEVVCEQKKSQVTL